MLETIVSWFVGVIAELLDAVVVAFLGMMQIDLSSLSASFPALKSGYLIFQGISLGLIILIAVWQLFKFFVGQLAEIRDTPIRILIRSAIAGMMVFFGGYFIELAVDLARIPYEILVAYDPNQAGMTFADMAENFDSMNLIDGIAITIGASAMLVLVLVVILLIGWNLLKLMIEVLERFLLIGVLAYSSPLIFSTLASQSTAEIFRRWVSMFAGQCAIMTISAWMLKLVISGFTFTETDTNILFRLLLTLAMCKIAQRVDTYMQQLGIGVATTGGNLIDEVVGMGMLLGRGFGGGRYGRRPKNPKGGGDGDSPVLGAGPDGSLSRFGGLLGGISNAAQQAARQWRNGEPASSIGGNLAKSFAAGMGITKGANTLKSAVTDGSLTTRQRISKVAKGTAQVFGGAVMAGTPANAARRFREARDNARRETVQAAARGAKDFSQRSSDARYHAPDSEDPYNDPTGQGYDNTENMKGAEKDLRREQQESMMTASQFFESNRRAHGLGEYKVDQDGDADLDDVAKRAGLRLDKSAEKPSIEGRDDVVGDFLSKNYQDFAQNKQMQEFAVNTAQNGSPLAAEQALNNPFNDLTGNDELGDSLIKNAYGEQAITGKPDNELNGHFKNIRAETIGEYGRIIHTDYVGADGKTTHYDLHNAEALNNESKGAQVKQFMDGAAQKYTTVQGMGSGTTMHIRSSSASSQDSQPTSGSGHSPQSDRSNVSSTNYVRKKRPGVWTTLDPYDEDDIF